MGYFLHNTRFLWNTWNMERNVVQRIKYNNDIKVMGKWLDDSDTDAIAFYINNLDCKR